MNTVLRDATCDGILDHYIRRMEPTPAAPECAPHALVAFLSDHYAGSLADLNAAWESDSPGDDFAVITEPGSRPVPHLHDCNLQGRHDLQNFVHDALLPAWVRAVTTRVRAADPNDLLSSPGSRSLPRAATASGRPRAPTTRTAERTSPTRPFRRTASPRPSAPSTCWPATETPAST